MPDTLTLLGHTTTGNLIFETHDNTQYVCEQPVPGTAVWKNQNGNLHRAGKLSTVGPEFVLDRTACKCCGLQSNCHVCRSTDAAFETDFQTAGWPSIAGMKHSIKKVMGRATVEDNAVERKRQRAEKWQSVHDNVMELFKGGSDATKWEQIQNLFIAGGLLAKEAMEENFMHSHPSDMQALKPKTVEGAPATL